MIEKAFDEKLAKDIEFGGKFGKIKMRNGRPARIICWDAKGNKPIVALIDHGSFEQVCMFTKDGKYDARENVRSNYDLIIETEGGEA